MKTFESGNQVAGGYYLSRENWEVVTVEGETGVLPGKKGERFLRVSVPMVLMLAPVLGGAFVMFLPFIGFAMAGKAIGAKVVQMTRETVGGMAETVSPGWRPGEAYMTGKPGAEGDAQSQRKDEVVEKLEKEIDARKAEEKK